MSVIKGLDKLKAKLNNISDSNLKDVMNDAVLLVHAQAKALAPVDTGNLAGSIHPKVINNGESIIGKVYTNLIYAPFVEFGTGIKGNGSYPNENISLSYRNTGWVYTPDGGSSFYYTEGQIAQPFMYPAIKQNEKQIEKMFRDAIKINVRGGK